jgi:hypothetical protein
MLFFRKLDARLLMGNEKQDDFLDRDIEYHFHIGNFVHHFSHVEELIKMYFSSLFPGYEQDLQLLGHKEGLKAISLLKSASKILSERTVHFDEKKFNKLLEDFKTLNNKRNYFLHGGWAINPKGGYVLCKAPRKFTKRKDIFHFKSVDDLITLNEECEKWGKHFKEITKVHEPLIDKNIDNSNEHLIATGRFIVQFSQLETSIRFWVADLYGISGDAYIFCEEDFASQLIDDLSVKLEGEVFDSMKKDFKKLNDTRNLLIHDCSNYPLQVEEIKNAFLEADKLTQEFTRRFLWLKNQQHIVESL